MSSRNYVSQQTRTDAPALMRWLDLNFANLQNVSVVVKLDHAHLPAFEFHNVDVAPLPALGAMLTMTAFIPTAPSGEEKLLVHRPPKCFEPGLVRMSRWIQTIVHSLEIVSDLTCLTSRFSGDRLIFVPWHFTHRRLLRLAVGRIAQRQETICATTHLTSARLPCDCGEDITKRVTGFADSFMQ